MKQHLYNTYNILISWICTNTCTSEQSTSLTCFHRTVATSIACKYETLALRMHLVSHRNAFVLPSLQMFRWKLIWFVSPNFSTSISQTFRSWVALAHLRPRIAFLSHNSDDISGIAALMNVLFWWPFDFQISFSGRDMSRKVCNCLLGSYIVYTEILSNNFSRMLHDILEQDYICSDTLNWSALYTNSWPFYKLDLIPILTFLNNFERFP